MINLLLILLLAAVIFVFVQRKQSPETMTPILYVLVVLIFIVSGFRMFCSGRTRGSVSEAMAASQAFQKASAYRLGQAVAQDIDSGSAVLVVFDGSDHDFVQRNRETLLSGFQEGLGQGYTVHTHGVRPPQMEMGPDGEVIDEPIDEAILYGEELMQALSRHSDAKAVVSFMGFPFFRGMPRAGSVPPLYVMGGMDVGESPLIQRGMVNAYVTHRMSGVDWNAQPRRGMSQEDVFNLRFELKRPGR